ncbi:hypothetical protein [Flavobacterium columnare]|uniref:Uncharacterized protein n=1 Tax=Flavobacterium columnare TaxID=996 RepID=A0AAI8GBT0_9FLAO|nr:hypothetical protein [Flavobacterium columnare]AMO21129.1 hypothetical protein UN65_13015 [Flavobacterium columnare]AUX19145.1 hypothetical protein AQ623_13280 [Flavobacterium columnare]QOG58220.1 hypothetical protein HUE29_13065 [Flavobacterium columnare]QOG60943.1 hypothetical protein HUE30_13065 [Flavobacterium columnare]QOG63663.1 hypothetical protein HUE31_13065 [Flavobacterium columnare]
MGRINFILIFFFVVFKIDAQENNCNKVNDSLYFIEIDIRRSDNYPIIMSGVCKEISFDLLTKENEELFVNSFYKLCFYTPDIQGNNKKIILNYLEGKELESYLLDYRNEVLKMSSKINKNSLEKTIKLKNNCNVFLRICKIKGVFLVTNKANNNISKNSNELEIKDISEIDKVYIPLKISCYKRPKRKEFL